MFREMLTSFLLPRRCVCPSAEPQPHLPSTAKYGFPYSWLQSVASRLQFVDLRERTFALFQARPKELKSQPLLSRRSLQMHTPFSERHLGWTCLLRGFGFDDVRLKAEDVIAGWKGTVLRHST